MAHDPRAIANWFIEQGIKENNPLSHIEVQKLLYFSHGWMLGIHETPLHHGSWEAWRYGPVLPEIYFNLNGYRGQPITTPIPSPSESFSAEELAIMEGVYNYRGLGPFTLTGISHALEGPWDRVWHDGRRSNAITNQSIRSYFADLHHQRGGSGG